MQVAIHLGAHSTDEERLLKTLLQNKGKLIKDGISVPGPGRYRKIVIRAAQKLKGEIATIESRDALFDAILDDNSIKRVILTCEDFICVPGRVFENGFLYDKASFKPSWLAGLFPGCEIEFFISIRNPATFIPAVFKHRLQNIEEFNNFLHGVNLDQVRWSDVVHSIKENNPNSPVTVWCNEDTPLLWRTIVQKISAYTGDANIHGGMNIIGSIMEKEGQRRMRAYLAAHPPKGETQWRRIATAFLEKYALQNALEEELDVPGWTDELVEMLSENYEEDQAEIARMPGIEFLSL